MRGLQDVRLLALLVRHMKKREAELTGPAGCRGRGSFIFPRGEVVEALRDGLQPKAGRGYV